MTHWILLFIPTISEKGYSSWSAWTLVGQLICEAAASIYRAYTDCPAYPYGKTDIIHPRMAEPVIGYWFSFDSKKHRRSWDCVYWRYHPVRQEPIGITLRWTSAEILLTRKWYARFHLQGEFFSSNRLTREYCFSLYYQSGNLACYPVASRRPRHHVGHYLKFPYPNIALSNRDDQPPIAPLVNLLAKLDEDLPECPRKRTNSLVKQTTASAFKEEEDALTLLTSFFYPMQSENEKEFTHVPSAKKKKFLKPLILSSKPELLIALGAKKRKLMQSATICFQEIKEQLLHYRIQSEADSLVSREMLNQYDSWINRLILLQQTHTDLLMNKLAYCQSSRTKAELPNTLPLILWIQSKYSDLNVIATSLDTPASCALLLCAQHAACEGHVEIGHAVIKLMARAMLSYLYFRGSILNQLEAWLHIAHQEGLAHTNPLLKQSYLALLHLKEKSSEIKQQAPSTPADQFDNRPEIAYNENPLLAPYREFMQLFGQFCAQKVAVLDQFLFA